MSFKTLKRRFTTLEIGSSAFREDREKIESKANELKRLLVEMKKERDAFRQLPIEEQQRIIQDMRESPASDFTGGDAKLAMYAEALKKVNIRNFESLIREEIIA